MRNRLQAKTGDVGKAKGQSRIPLESNRLLPWMLGASALAMRSTVAAVPLLALVAPSLAIAQTAEPVKVGDTVADPITGEDRTIIAVFDGAVLTEGYVLVLDDPRVGGQAPDPDDASSLLIITAVSMNAVTGLVDQVTLSDGRTIDVARDVSAQINPQTSADPLAAFDPLPVADENRNTIGLTSFNGSNGANGDSNILTAQGKDGNNGSRRSGTTTRSYASDIEAISGIFLGQPIFLKNGIALRGTGGRGGNGSGGTPVIGTTGGDGGNGGGGTLFNITSNSTISTGEPLGYYGISVRSQGGNGGDAGDGAFGLESNGGGGGNGGSGGTVTVTNGPSGNITTRRANASGIYALSRGGSGGDGGDGGKAVASLAGSAGNAGNGGTVTIRNDGKIHTFGNSAHGMLGQSLGGTGGDGGDAGGIFSYSGSGSGGGLGGSVTLENRSGGFIYTGGNDAHGLLAQSVGGGGGASGTSGGLVALGGSAGSGKSGGNTTARNQAGGIIVTDGQGSFGLLAQSVGGGGGSAGASAGLVSIGGRGGSGSRGGTTRGENDGYIGTTGSGAHGMVVQSIGGGGGTGSNSLGLLVSVGGTGTVGGTGGLATIINNGTIKTDGGAAHGGIVQSIGGGGGNGGTSGGAISVGGSASRGGDASTVNFTNRGLIETNGIASLGILAQSIGGGGGNGASSGGLISVGGSAGGGGDAGTVNVDQASTIITRGIGSHGIVAQSVGGGGGNGGQSTSVSAFVGVAVGGAGGSGGRGGTVDIDFISSTETIDGVSRNLLPLISTEGILAHGLVAQSVGGGGGNGGSAFQGTLGAFGAVSVAVGGSGSSGGKGGTVRTDGDALILTDGAFSNGILAQSVGGGGGNGGSAIALTGSIGVGGSVSLSVGVGGSGGSGGEGGTVDINSGGFIGTKGVGAHGIIAQSVGGGGGNGGFSVSVAAAASDGVAVSVPVGVGGSGGSGGKGGQVDLDYIGDIATTGILAHGILAQSVGGGGGNGGFNTSVGLAASGGGAGSVAVGVGGTGGSGGDGWLVNVNTEGALSTAGMFSNALVAQSVGGSGGNGGYNVAGSIAGSGGVSGALSVGVGGAGGGAGVGMKVDANHIGTIYTAGNNSNGFIAQSVGGGGGNGGLNVSGGISLTPSTGASISVGVGGAGGDGGDGGIVMASIDGAVMTVGDASEAILAQSLGGGGGNGGLNVAAGITAASNGGTVNVGVGGAGGKAGSGKTVNLDVKGSVLTEGDDSDAITAQSLGGGGGNGGLNVSAGLTLSTGASGTLGVGVGGFGGDGGTGGTSFLSVAGNVRTEGDNSAAVISQSLGGGGGNGGINVTGTVAASSGGTGTLGVGIGGFGGGGGEGKTALAFLSGAYATEGSGSKGVLVQSVGGGGGNGGLNVSAGVALSTSSAIGGTFGLGGFGGLGGSGGFASLNLNGDVSTSGGGSDAVVVQSIGGGGGNGGMNVAGGLTFSSGTSVAGALGIGGFGGGGGFAQTANATVNGNVIASGVSNTITAAFGDGESLTLRQGGSNGILVQSVGGSGGAGGMNISGGIGASGSGKSLSIGFGGFGGSGGNGGLANASVFGGQVSAIGDQKSAVIVQSLGGGGGEGGINISGGIAANGSLTLGIGGFGGDGGTGGSVNAGISSDLFAQGWSANGLLAQSIGGGGGNGGINVSGGISAGGGGSIPAVAFGLGGGGGAGNIGGQVDVAQNSLVSVTGIASKGIFAQSVGGGGGNGGLNVTAAAGTASSFNLGIGVGGSGGTGADGGIVTLGSDGAISVNAGEAGQDLSGLAFASGRGTGIHAQSIGGGGGNAGFNVTGAGTNKGVPITLGIGGSGDNGGMGGEVIVNRGLIEASQITVQGDNGTGLLAQSIGGGGGNAGGNLTLAASLKAKFDVQVSIGGSGGTGGDGGAVTVNHAGNILVDGNNSRGLVAQSIGGGGGQAAVNINGSLVGNRKDDAGKKPGTKTLDLAIGGGPGDGSDGGLVTVDHNGIIETQGENSAAVLAQSIGGGGGNAASNYSQNINDDGSISVALGRIGGTGGIGGEVLVASAGNIITQGSRSYGVQAQSIGGGGGNSSSNSFNVAGDREKQKDEDKEAASFKMSASLNFGLEGGSGSRSGNVTIDNAAIINTAGSNAHGVFAQSIGGGGGAGGSSLVDEKQEALDLLVNAITGSGSADDSSIAVTYQAGGKGGTGAVSGDIAISNTGLIRTTGDGANAIKAQAIGGGGGDGGSVLNLAKSGKGDSLTLDFAIGGEGGTGAMSGAVGVTNLGQLQTQGDDAAALHAQSIGGGGGNGGLAGNIAISKAGEGNSVVVFNYNLGGKGGLGGAAGNVTVDNGSVDNAGARIVTSGNNSHAIHAQSIGGGGGNGGATISGNLAIGSGNTQLGVTIGGDGEIGGLGGLTTVNNYGRIQTSGEAAHGIFAQSIGGGGGNGGLSLAGSILLSDQADPTGQFVVALGGSGGRGNDAGNVIVNNDGSIVTSGKNAHGILAQSLGGGGGNMSLGIALSQNSTVNYVANAVGLLLGGRPGEGGLGGEVTVNHSGDITVFGDGARAVVAESINGGGGGLTLNFGSLAGFAAGSDIVNAVLGDTKSDKPALTILGGAAGQGASNAAKVTLNLAGTIGAAGSDGAAVNQQSIGGGGGRTNLNLGFAEEGAGEGDPLDLELGLGGQTGNDNNGGEIVSVHTGNVVTEGVRTPGLFIQSIGGGGGRTSARLSGPNSRLGELDLSLGGSNLTLSSGGQIQHVQNGTISTTGDGASGAIIQSIGGGGGHMSLAFVDTAPATASLAADTQRVQALPSQRIAMVGAVTPVSGQIALGAVGGSGIDGGIIDFGMTGDVVTQGHFATGLLLQSIGAGGGYADLSSISGVETILGASGGAAGDGGAITVSQVGSLVTQGDGSHGLVLQSIGGGGGVVYGNLTGSSLTLSDENSGNGGAITLDLVGNITTGGTQSYGLLAQSLGGGGGIFGTEFAGAAGGAGSGGAISLNIDGDVIGLADGSIGVFAQSTGADGGGDIALTLAADHSISAGLGGTAIAFDGGATNLITNNGLIMTMDGMGGTAISGTSGSDQIVNNGMIVGNLALGGGVNAVQTTTAGTFISSTTLDLGGASNTFTNSGLLAPGDTTSIAQTALNGSFVQTSEGITFTEIDLATQQFDAINATGSVEVGGTLDVTLLNVNQFTPGMFSAQLFTGDQGASAGDIDLRADSSIVLGLLGFSVAGGAVQVDYSLSYAPVEAIGNRGSVGEYLNRVQTAGTPAALQPTFDALLAIQDVSQYVDVLTQLGSEFYAEQNAHALRGAQSFTDRISECGTVFGGKVRDNGEACVWSEVNLDTADLSAQNGMPAINSDTTSVSAGMIQKIGKGLSVAAAFSYSDYDLGGYTDRWSATGEALSTGLGVQYDIGKSRVGAYFTVAGHNYDTARMLPDFGSATQSTRDLLALTGQLKASHQLNFGSITLVPALSLGLTKLSKGRAFEVGAQPNDLAIDSASGTHAWAMPSLDIAYNADLSGGWTLRPFAKAAARFALTSPETEVSARFRADATTADPFLSISPLGRTDFSGEVGLEASSASGFTLGASYRLHSAGDRDGDVVAVRVLYQF